MGSAWYVYAIVGEDTPLPLLERGHADVGLTRLRCGKLAAIAGPAPDDRLRLTTEAALHHEAVVEAVRLQGPGLPVRFGTVFRDAAAVECALLERYDVLAADLERIGDKVELSLTVLWPRAANDAGSEDVRATSAPSAPAMGAAYLRARAAELERSDALTERARALARELDDTLGSLALERRVAIMPKPLVAVRATYLLDPGAVAAFRAAFDAMREVRGELRVLLTGPWPPYSFVRQGESVGSTPGSGLAEIARRFTDRMWGRAG